MDKLPILRPASLALLSTLALANYSNLSFAQQEALEEIIVQGEKVSRSLQKTVSSVGVLSESQIEEAGIYDLQEAYKRLANVSQAFGEEGITIRGINHASVGGGGSGGLVSMHIDGAFLSEKAITVGQTELWDIRQVEVFRGGQSTNQGRNSLGGAVFIRSNDPSYHWETKYRAMYGEDNTRALSLAVGGPLIDEQLAFRVAIDDQHTDGNIDNQTLGDQGYGSSSNTLIRAKLLAEPHALPGLSFLATLSFSENQSGDPAASLIDGNGDLITPFSRLNFSNIAGFENHDQSIATLETRYEISEQWSLTNIASWNRSEYQRQDDSDRQASGGIAARTRTDNADTFSEELRLDFSGEILHGNFGLFYYQREMAGTIVDRVPQDLTNTIVNLINRRAPALVPSAEAIAGLYPVPVIFTRDGPTSREVKNWAIYGSINYHLSDFVTLFAGLRYDNEEVERMLTEERSLESTLPNPSALPAALAPAAPLVSGINAQILSALDIATLDTETDYDALLPMAGVTLNWSDELNTSFRVQRSYRAGGSGSSTSGNFEYDPEYTTTYEFALRSQWLDGGLSFNGNVFYVDWSDQQVQVVDPLNTTEFRTINAGESRLRGFELETAARLSPGLSFFVNLGHTDTEFTRFIAETANDTRDFSGNEFIGAAKWSSAAGLHYRLGELVTLQADINYLEGSFDNIDNTLSNDSRTLINAKLSYRLNDHIKASLVARNLFDKDYITRNNVTGKQVVNLGQPRVVVLQIEGGF